MRDLSAFAEKERDAHISACGAYRYWLSRVWDRARPILPYVLLNPSVADASIDDPTVRRGVGFAMRDGYGGILFANLYALRSTDPAALLVHPDPVGPANDQVLADLGRHAAVVVCAWGAMPFARRRGRIVAGLLAAGGARTVCLGTTKAGAPKHPLYLRGDAAFVPWSPEWAGASPN